ncbi:MAG: transcription antitermination factor NusB [Bryobacteraceae bacterium]
MISPARLAAFQILERVRAGGYASDLLLARTAGLDSRDAGLASEIVLGSLRRQGQLDYLIQLWSGRPPSRMDTAVLIALRLGIYQIRYLDRVPAHAAVGESVELVKKARKRSAAGFVNAVLRKAGRETVAWPDRATELSQPDWLLERWNRQFGEETATRIASAFLEAPETWVRNPPRDRADLQLEPSDVPGAFRVISGDVTGLRIQDIGSQSIVPLLELEPGQSFLDLCAAPGNKTMQALESGVQAVACDLHIHRLRNVQGCARLALDATVPLPFGRKFDRILVDAPCSGTGTLGRNPEIRWRLQAGDIADLHEKQTSILRNALNVLAPTGILVYATCSLEQEENDDVLERTMRERPQSARLVRIQRRIPGIDSGDGFFAAVLTSV